MSAAEYASWQEMNGRIGHPNMRASSPCRDCPLWFRTLSESEGCCNSDARETGRPRLASTGDYARDRERARWRENSRRQREKQRTRALQTATEAVTLDGAAGRPASVAKPPPRLAAP